MTKSPPPVSATFAFSFSTVKGPSGFSEDATIYTALG